MTLFLNSSLFFSPCFSRKNQGAMAKYVRSKVPMEVALHLRSELSFALGKLVSVGTSILFKGQGEKKNRWCIQMHVHIYIYVFLCYVCIYIYISYYIHCLNNTVHMTSWTVSDRWSKKLASQLFLLRRKIAGMHRKSWNVSIHNALEDWTLWPSQLDQLVGNTVESEEIRMPQVAMENTPCFIGVHSVL